MASRLRKARRRRAETFAVLIWPDQQAHQLRTIVREMRICSAARNDIASEIGTLRRAVFYAAYLRLGYASLGWFNLQRHTRTRKRDFP